MVVNFVILLGIWVDRSLMLDRSHMNYVGLRHKFLFIRLLIYGQPIFNPKYRSTGKVNEIGQVQDYTCASVRIPGNRYPIGSRVLSRVGFKSLHKPRQRVMLEERLESIFCESDW